MHVPALDLDAFDDVPYPVATVRELRRKGRVTARMLGRDLLIVWNDGAPRAYTDACPHLGLPLSLGTVRGGRVQCRYHGWAFDSDSGAVVEQPTLRKPLRCKLTRHGALIAGDLVFAWLGDPEATEAARAQLPENLPHGVEIFRVVFDCPHYLALFSSVDYAHFPYHTGYRPLYRIYRMFRPNQHQPGTAFPSKVVHEDDRQVTVRIEDADRTIRVYACATEMDDDGPNWFQTFVTPLDPSRTLYWETYRPRSRGPVNLVARAAFRTVTTRLLSGEDRVWTGAAAPNFLRGDNIHLCENDVPLGAHLRRFVLPRLRG
jgi:phenylpropionate dioxygenase-like ring-hydroxylating dioxygenase large terminal subunit